MLMLTYVYLLCIFFFFKQKTAYEMRISDWSSDVCSSDLLTVVPGADLQAREIAHILKMVALGAMGCVTLVDPCSLAIAIMFFVIGGVFAVDQGDRCQLVPSVPLQVLSRLQCQEIAMAIKQRVE